jgi:hypothetical protein
MPQVGTLWSGLVTVRRGKPVKARVLRHMKAGAGERAKKSREMGKACDALALSPANDSATCIEVQAAPLKQKHGSRALHVSQRQPASCKPCPHDGRIMPEGLRLAATAFHHRSNHHMHMGKQLSLSLVPSTGQRIMQRIESGPNGCWHWTGSRNNSGYGTIRMGKRVVTAHRVMYVMVNGELEDSTAVIMHTCDNPQCVNPAHLKAGTHLQNMQDAVAKGRFKKARE